MNGMASKRYFVCFMEKKGKKKRKRKLLKNNATVMHDQCLSTEIHN